MMLKTVIISIIFITNAYAIKLSDYTPYDYKALFTNPICKNYYYDNDLVMQNNEITNQKNKNAYCKKSDTRASENREESPHFQLLKLIENENLDEIFMAYLSFSKSSIAKALCSAVKYKGIKLTVIIDKNNEDDPSRMATVNQLSSCYSRNGGKVDIQTRGGEGRGRNKLGYAHNKLIYANFKNSDAVKIVFSSGNMSSGVSTHHENWHFVTTNKKSFFAQAHLCLKEGMLNHGQGIKEYSDFITSCKKKISAPEESDIKTFFVPGEGDRATNAILSNLKNSDEVMMAAHRFSYGKLISGLSDFLAQKKKTKLVVDDDVYWTGQLRYPVGRNNGLEYKKIYDLIRKGMDVHYMETWSDSTTEPTSLQLQHNKFLIFSKNQKAHHVFTGAGNLTSSAFNSNYENFYLISIPEVLSQFEKQYDYMWNKLTRSYYEMPKEYELP